MAGGGTFRASRGKSSCGAKSRSLQTRTPPTPSSPPTILLQPQCPMPSGTTPQLVSRTPTNQQQYLKLEKVLPMLLTQVQLYLKLAAYICFFTDQDSPQQPRGPRGAYLNKNIPIVASERKVIHIYGLTYLEPEVPRMISKDFKGHFYWKETEWHKLDKNLVEHLYKCFQRDETGIDPTKIQLFERVHKLSKCKGEWCDAREKNVHSKYHDIVKEKNTSEVEISDEGIVTDANPPLHAPLPFDAQAWVNATGDPQKTVYGFRLTKEAENIQKQVKPSSTKQSTFHASTSSNNESNSESEIAELKRENASLKARESEIDELKKENASLKASVGYSSEQVTAIVQTHVSCVNSTNIPSTQLNYRSFSIELRTNVSKSYTRTVTDVGDASLSYTLKFFTPPNIDVSVSPSTLIFAAVNQKLSYEMTFTPIESGPVTQFSEGALFWNSAKHSVRSPISIKFT
ncbi:peptidase S8, subtilisin-related protein [Artemisia annua]|uniref:Peptidase S8, subtilisin-related protein n=1 Tax=Artemisia annua TaxID=35608 RepID=A0A2U1KFC6_ARTAN|nr:peptidase S8, subtilisin-related protein [Artemisia annua]